MTGTSNTIGWPAGSSSHAADAVVLYMSYSLLSFAALCVQASNVYTPVHLFNIQRKFVI
jgi:hypothetical protein